jgi:hypothetical protein
MSVSREGGALGFVIVSTDIGTWSLDGDRLTGTINDIDWQFEGASPAVSQRAEQRTQ